MSASANAMRHALGRALWDVGVFSAAVNVLLLISPLYLLQVYDRVLPAQSLSTLIHLSLIALAGLAVLGGLEVVRGAYASRIATRLDLRLGEAAFRACLAGPRAALGDVQPLRDLATVRGFVASRSIFFVFDLPFAPLFLAILYFVHPLLFWMTVGGMVVLLLLAVLGQLVTRKKMTAAAEQLAGATALAQAFVRAGETVRALGMTNSVAQAWGRRHAESLAASAVVADAGGAIAGISRTFRGALQVAILGVGAWLVLQHEITAGMIFASNLLSGRALQPLDQIIGVWAQTIDAQRAWRRLQTIDGIEPLGGDFRLPELAGRLGVENLVYTPPGAQSGGPLIKRVSFAVDPGEALAIVGPSRAGKSTLARLLVGALAPQSGHVRLDGAELGSFSRDDLGRRLGYMPQEVDLLPGSVADNIARFEPGERADSVVDAAKAANAHAAILAIRNGYKAEVGPSGQRLSGGERQRIALARAFYGTPSLLVLDEPNAHLDSEGEQALEQAIEGARQRGAAVVVVTHKPSLAARCDRILILRDGQVEMIGPARDILKRLIQPAEVADAQRRQEPSQASSASSTVVPMPVAQSRAD